MKFANVHDTLLAHHAYASHLPQRLDHVVSEYCDARPWKKIWKSSDEDEKGVTPDHMSGEDLCKYNAADAILTMKSWTRMQSDLEPERHVYEHDRKLASICREMTVTGIGVDLEYKAQLSESLSKRRGELRTKLQGIVRDPSFDPGQLAAVRHHLFHPSSLGARYVQVTKKGLASTANATLEALRMSGNERHEAFATALLQWRLVGKVKSTYVDVVGAPHDRGVYMSRHSESFGRAHFNWKPFGTVSGRLSGRLQSAPRWKGSAPESRVRGMYCASPGNELVYYDVSQAEMRLAAYLSNDPVFIAACSGDVHANNARAVFPKALHLIDDPAALKDPERGKPYRDIAKNLGFAISYLAEVEKVFQTLRSKGFQVTFGAVSVILAKLHAAYKVYYAWVHANYATVKQLGYMRTPFLGRIRWLGWYPKITDVANYPIQSGLADIVNRRTIELAALLPPQAQLVAQVHDACIYDVPKSLVSETKEIIAGAWSESIDTPGGKLILPIDLKSKARWSEL